MKKVFKIAIWIVALLLVSAGLIVARWINSVDLDRDEAYMARVSRIWPQVFVESAGSDVEKPSSAVVARVLQGLMHNPLMDDGPYLVAYPVTGVQRKTAILVIPGGGYIIRAEKNEGQDIAQWLNQHCMAAFVLNYRLAPHQAPLDDALRAIRWLRFHHEEFNIDPGKIGVMGFSAGGHLAALASTLYALQPSPVEDEVSRQSARPDFSVLAYPVISFRAFTHEGSLLALLGENAPDKLRESLSAERQVTTDTPPAFAWAPKSDFVVPYQNAQMYADALTQHGVQNELHIFPEGMHGSGLAQDEEYANAWPQLLVEWLHREKLIPASSAQDIAECRAASGAI